MSKAMKYWTSYRRLTDFPTATRDRAERNVGIFVYSLCFFLAGGLLVSMLLGESQTYINYETSGGDYMTSVLHRPPDIILCPNGPLWPKRMFEVYYDENLINDLNMTNDHVNLITKTYFNSCEMNKKCKTLDQKCEDTPFAPFCRALVTWVSNTLEKHKSVNQTKLRNAKILRPYQEFVEANRKALVLKDAVAKGTLQMMWLAIISSRYQEIQARHRSMFPDREIMRLIHLIICFYYTEGEIDPELGNQCALGQEDIWIGSARCSLVRGNRITQNRSPYVGFRKALSTAPFRYWVGNLESTTVTENLLNTVGYGMGKWKKYWRKVLGPLPVTGVGHYSMIRWSDVPGVRLPCLNQPDIKGLPSPIHNCGDVATDQPTTSWYYDIKYQKRPHLTVWIYPQTMQKMEKYQSYTAYTQFQVGAGLLSCFVGFSFLQIVELVISSFTKLKFLSKTILNGAQLLSLLLAIALTFLLTSLDLYWYLGSRYTTIFKQKNVTLEFPVVQFCSDHKSPYLFINTSKMASYGASVNFYAFIRFAGWQIQPVINVASRTIKGDGKNSTFEVREWMQRNWVRNLKSNRSCSKDCSLRPRDTNPWIDYVLKGFAFSEKYPRRINVSVHKEFMKGFIEDDLKKMAAYLVKENSTVADFREFFSLDPRELITCSIKGQHIKNCGQYGSYFLETGQYEFCLSLQVPQSALPVNHEHLSLDNSFKVSYDSRKYKRDSDFNSYYGPGLEEEKARDYAFNHCQGKTKMPQIFEGGWVRSSCWAGRSWKIKIAHPSWAQNYIQLQHPPMGLIDHQLHTISVQSSFSNKLPLNSTSCLPNEKLTCRFPKEEATAVFKALQYYAWCKCYYCVNNEVGFVNRLQTILGNQRSCCTPSQYLGCYGSYLEKAKWNVNNGRYDPDTNFDAINHFMRKIADFSDTKTLREMTTENIGKWIRQPEMLSTKELENLAIWTRKCFEEPCLKKSFTMMSYHNEPSNEELVNVTIVYDSNIGVGTEQVDRLDVAQLLGILLCSYSVTIGIGVIGLFEVAFLAIGRLKGSKKFKLTKTIHEHLFRGLSPITEFDSIVKIAPEDDKNNLEKDDKEEVNEVKQHIVKIEGKTHQNEKVLKVVSLENQKNVTLDVQQAENVVANKNSSVKPNNFDLKDVGERGNEEVKEHPVQPDSEAKKHTFLLIALVLGTCCVIALLAYFFISLETEYSADITVSPFYEKPSVALCIETAEEAVVLWKALEESSCTKNEEKTTKCSEIFTDFIHVKSGQYCFMLDNSGTYQKLNRYEDDLSIEMPQNSPSPLVFVNGLNGTDMNGINPYFRWQNMNVSISYSTKAYQREYGCASTVTDKKCSPCSIAVILKKPRPVQCCSTGKDSPRFLPQTCFEYVFGVSFAPTNPGKGTTTKRLVIRASSNFVIIYKVKSKHNIPMLISISGGFISSFTEVTFLNIVAIALFFTWKKAQPRKISKSGEENFSERKADESEKVVRKISASSEMGPNGPDAVQEITPMDN